MKTFKFSLLFVMFIVLIPVWMVAQNVKLPADSLNRTDLKGKKYGYWVKKDAKGKLKYEGRFKDNYPVGEFRYYDENEKLENITLFTEKGVNAKTVMFYPDGIKQSEGCYINRVKNGIWRLYNEKGKILTEEAYKGGRKDGVSKLFAPDSSIIESTTWKNGEKNGSWMQTDKRGTVKANFKNNLMDGVYEFYFPNGKLKLKGSNIMGMKTGVWNFYNEMGTLVKRIFYRNDTPVKTEIQIVTDKKIFYQNVDSIMWVHKMAAKTTICQKSGNMIYCNNNPLDLLDLVGIDKFLRINERFFTNISAVVSYKTVDEKKGEVILNPHPDFEVWTDEEGTLLFQSIYEKKPNEGLEE